MYKLQEWENRIQQFNRLAELWETVPEPQKRRIQALYNEYNRISGWKSGDGESLERAFIEVMTPVDRTREVIEDGAAEYEEIMRIQDANGAA